MHSAFPKSDTPFFIFYAPRSGSTFLANEIMTRAAVVMLPETNFVPNLLTAFPTGPIAAHDLEKLRTTLESDPKFKDLELDVSAIHESLALRLPLPVSEVIRVICRMYLRDQRPHRIGFKKGSYVRHFERLKHEFPQAQFIGIIRDGRAVFSSQKRSIYSRTQRPFETCPKRCAESWKEVTRLIRTVERRYPESTCVVKYEDLVASTDSVMRGILKFLDTPPKPDVASAGQYNIPDRYGDLHANVGRPPLTNRTSAWRNELADNEIRRFELVACKELVAEGYETTHKRYWLLRCLGL